MVLDGLLLGFVVTVLTQVIKVLTPRIDKEWMQLVVFGLVFVGTFVFSIFVSITPQEWVTYLFTTYASAVAIYETVIKRITNIVS